jgi:EAL domain-containing protein (putative c-di-GMP-specific phosphodiesterase class I)
MAFMRRLGEVGCRFALCGVGREPLSFKLLKDAKFDYLKIEAGLVIGLPGSAAAQGLVKAINRVAHDRAARTIAVCVESDAALEVLRRSGTDFAQGYAVGVPVPLEGVPPGSPPASLRCETALAA